MALITNEELLLTELAEMDDIRYFRENLIHYLKSDAPIASLEKNIKQLALLEEALNIKQSQSNEQ